MSVKQINFFRGPVEIIGYLRGFYREEDIQNRLSLNYTHQTTTKKRVAMRKFVLCLQNVVINTNSDHLWAVFSIIVPEKFLLSL